MLARVADDVWQSASIGTILLHVSFACRLKEVSNVARIAIDGCRLKPEATRGSTCRRLKFWFPSIASATRGSVRLCTAENVFR